MTRGLSISEIGRKAQGLSPGTDDLLSQLLGARGARVVVDGQDHPALRQCSRHDPAEAPPRSGDEGNAPG